MKFTTILTKEDFYRFNQYAMAKVCQRPQIAKKVAIFNFLYWFFGLLFVVGIFLVYYNNSCCDYVYLNLSLGAIIAWFFLSSAWQKIYARLYTFEAVSEKRWDYELRDLDFIQSDELSISTFSWQYVRSVEKDRHNLYLFTDIAQAFVLPLGQIDDAIESTIRAKVEHLTQKGER